MDLSGQLHNPPGHLEKLFARVNVELPIDVAQVELDRLGAEEQTRSGFAGPIGSEPSYEPVDGGGAGRAAALIAELL